MTTPDPTDPGLPEAVGEWIRAFERELAARPAPPDPAELGRYRDLVALRDALEERGARGSRRRLAVGVVVAVLALAPLVLTVRVPRTEVSVSLEAEEVALRTAGPEPVLEALDLAFAEASGATTVEVPRPVGPSDVVTTGTARVAVAGPAGRVRLWQLIVPPRRPLTFTAEPDGAYRVTLSESSGGDGPELHVAVDGPVRIVGGAGLAVEATYPSARQVRVVWSDRRATLRLAVPEGSPPADGAGPAFATQVVVDSLSFFRTDRSVQGLGQAVVRNVSTIRSGTIRYEALDGIERELGAGDGIRFRSVEGVVRTLAPVDGGMRLAFQGDVTGMATGTGRNGRSAMPTLFAWLRARHSLELIWAGLAYALTMALSLHRWWRSPS